VSIGSVLVAQVVLKVDQVSAHMAHCSPSNESELVATFATVFILDRVENIG